MVIGARAANEPSFVGLELELGWINKGVKKLSSSLHEPEGYKRALCFS